jgi:hypothetical protein
MSRDSTWIGPTPRSSASGRSDVPDNWSLKAALYNRSTMVTQMLFAPPSTWLCVLSVLAGFAPHAGQAKSIVMHQATIIDPAAGAQAFGGRFCSMV